MSHLPNDRLDQSLAPSAAVPVIAVPVIAVIGMGYVGVPLAIAFAQHFSVIGFDIDAQKIDQLQQGSDHTGQLNVEEISQLTSIELTTNKAALARATIYIIAVPTPADAQMQPDLRPLWSASDLVGSVLKPGDLVIYESTVYPGCTEQECVPRLARQSGLRFNQDFFLGYSPERINPGDTTRRLTDIVKVTSGSTPQIAERVDALYQKIIRAGTFLAADIKTAEAAKVIENTQRDASIALINELAMLFARLGMDSKSVLDAAATKWNFVNLRPGLVGGHCIGVDPYYLVRCAEQVGMHPEMIATARRINEAMPRFIADQILRLAASKRVVVPGAKALVLGITFKENCADLRNTKVVALVHELQGFGMDVEIYDPWADADECRSEFQIEVCATAPQARYDVIVLAVAHQQFRALLLEQLSAWRKDRCVVYDIKQVLPRDWIDARL
jgi:UDP-N-acetyl-D-glucosamine/UDP-N-acetyl-D-galactosamine dehydrogenase